MSRNFIGFFLSLCGFIWCIEFFLLVVFLLTINSFSSTAMIYNLKCTIRKTKGSIYLVDFLTRFSFCGCQVMFNTC